jgi:hypothetical protein
LFRLVTAVLALAIAAPPAAAAPVVESSSTPYPGVTRTVYVDAAIPARIQVLAVDLSSSEITLGATREDQRGQTVSAFAAASGAQMAVNGDSFSPVDFTPSGLAMGQAMIWASSSDDANNGFLRFEQSGNRTHLFISPPEEQVSAADLPPATQGVIGGRPMLVRTGVAVTAFDCTDHVALPCERAPRTAAAVSADGNTLWLVVVDGWQAASHGMTAAELGGFLDGLGAQDALMLDSGGASTMYVGGVVNAPSDGVERVVANHLAVRHGALPPGQMLGFVRERDVIQGADIEGALVELDDGQTQTTGADGRFSFTSVAPHYTCATVSKAGYRTKTQCKQVVSNDLVYNSVALFPNSDFVDAAPGAPDAAIADAGPTLDAPAGAADATGPDAGDGGGDPGCGCSGGGPPASSAALLLAIIALCRVRRA